MHTLKVLNVLLQNDQNFVKFAYWKPLKNCQHHVPLDRTRNFVKDKIGTPYVLIFKGAHLKFCGAQRPSHKVCHSARKNSHCSYTMFYNTDGSPNIVLALHIFNATLILTPWSISYRQSCRHSGAMARFIVVCRYLKSAHLSWKITICLEIKATHFIVSSRKRTYVSSTVVDTDFYILYQYIYRSLWL